MPAPRVSVVVPCFNSERFLKRTLESVAVQTFSDFEVVVVDNHSQDGTQRIALSFRDAMQVSFVHASTNLAEARNVGMEQASGEFVAFVDSDDEWHPEKLKRQVEFLEANPDVPLCHTYCEVIDEESRPLHVRHAGLLPPTGPCYFPLLDHCVITISTVMIRRTLFTEDGFLFPPLPKKQGAGEDLRFYLLVARKYPFGLVNEVLAGYRKTATNLSSQAGWRVTPEDIRALSLVLEGPQYWAGFTPRATIVRALQYAALRNSEYWRAQGASGRAVWFAWFAVKQKAATPKAWQALAKAALCFLIPGRRGMAADAK